MCDKAVAAAPNRWISKESQRYEDGGIKQLCSVSKPLQYHTAHNNPQRSRLHTHRHENLKSYNVMFSLLSNYKYVQNRINDSNPVNHIIY